MGSPWIVPERNGWFGTSATTSLSVSAPAYWTASWYYFRSESQEWGRRALQQVEQEPDIRLASLNRRQTRVQDTPALEEPAWQHHGVCPFW